MTNRNTIIFTDVFAVCFVSFTVSPNVSEETWSVHESHLYHGNCLLTLLFQGYHVRWLWLTSQHGRFNFNSSLSKNILNVLGQPNVHCTSVRKCE